MNRIISRISETAKLTPDLVCYEDNGRSYTYKELDDQSTGLANLLVSRCNDDKPGPVLIYGGMGFEMVVSFIAAMKAGVSYAPIESSTPSDRVSLIAEVSEYSQIIAWETWPIVNDSGLIPREDLDASLVNNKTLSAGKPICGTDIAYMIFTSGTTGVPKGVQITYNNLSDFLMWCEADFGYKIGDNFLSQVPYSFDVSIMVTYSSLMVGGILHPIRKELISDFSTLFNQLKTCNLNVWISTPSFVEICLLDQTFNQVSYPGLKSFVLAGEELKHSTASELVKRFPDASVNNAYGPTEATVIVTKIKIDEQLLIENERLPIGYIKPGIDMFTIDENGNRLPDGESGELIISGSTVSPGYVNNPEKTKEAFFTYQGQPAYHTGDLAYIVDGLVYYQGRIDFQVKLHGYRIEIEDVEHHLRKVDYVKMATVVPKYKEHKVQQLVAYVVPEEHDFEKKYQLGKYIKEKMKERVMEYMVPQKFVFVESLPLTQNGKVDRKAIHEEVNRQC